MSYLGLEDFAKVRAALGQRVADARFLAKGRKNHADAADSDGMLITDDSVEVLPAVFHLTYEDSGGTVSERVVTITRIERRADEFYLHGRCHLRNAQRSFAVARIQEGFDITTGELFSDPAAFFGGHPLYSDPRQPNHQALQTCKHEINLLTVVGASDGLFDPDEQDVLLVHVFDRCDHLALEEDQLRQLLALCAPNDLAFRGSLIQMAHFKAGDATALRRSMRKLVDADGTLAPEEMNFVAEIEEVLAGRDRYRLGR